MRRAPGLSLLEVLVALGMVAVALGAGLGLLASLAERAAREPEDLLAEVCAGNELVRLRLARTLPPPGEQRKPCLQAGHRLELLTTVRASARPDLMQVQVQVRQGEAVLLSLSTVLGRN